MSYSIVEPSIEFIHPSTNYMELMEIAARTCYKSEDRITEGSAERLVKDVILKKGHESIAEHVNGVMCIRHGTSVESSMKFLWCATGVYSPERSPSRSMFAHRASASSGGWMYLSGNLRMWMHLDKEFLSHDILSEYCSPLKYRLWQKWPLFFEPPKKPGKLELVEILDENPLTNSSDFDNYEMLRHTALTYKLTCDRAMSHQLVRHRLGAYSQESQRWCDYGKKGFAFIVPPLYLRKHTELMKANYISLMEKQHQFYLEAQKNDIPPQDARRPLGNATSTKVVVTYTLEMWKHFHGMRTNNNHAEWMIRSLGKKVLAHQEKMLPGIFD